jgi:hypothetical protein
VDKIGIDMQQLTVTPMSGMSAKDKFTAKFNACGSTLF